MRKNGFTVIEMIVYMALLSVFIAVLSNIFTSSIDVQLDTEATSSVIHDGRFLLTRLSYDIRRAQSIMIPTNIGDTTTSLQLSIDSDTYTYNLTNGNLELTNASGTDRLNSIGTTVSNLTFQRIGNTNGKNTIRYGFTITSQTETAGGSEVRNFQTTVGVR